MEKISDTFCIEQIKKGNIQMFEHLVTKYKRMVSSIAWRVSNNQVLSEEIAQESFIKAYHNLERFQHNSKFSTWLFKITYNTAISYTKKEERHQPSAILIDNEQALFQNHYYTLTQLEEKERTQIVNKALRKLDSESRIILDLFYRYNFSTGEIADIMSLSGSNVKVKLFRARKELAVILQNFYKNSYPDLLN